jgi:hypothetical protein
MKMRQAWTWLFAGVIAAGLNATYHDGGMQWAHRAIELTGHNAEAVLALATGRADRFVLAANMIREQRESAACPLSQAWDEIRSRVQGRVENNVASEAQQKVWDKIQSRVAARQSQADRFRVMTARQEAEMDRWEAQRDRIQARVERLRIPSATFNPVQFRTIMVNSTPACSRIRVNVPQIPMIKMPAIPEVHVETGSVGPI